MKKSEVPPEDFYDYINQLSTKIIDRFNDIARETLPTDNSEVQGAVYEVISSYLLSHSIFIVRKFGHNEECVINMLRNAVGNALSISEMEEKFKYERKH